MNQPDINIISDVKNAMIFFLSGLNWTFIIMFGFVTYGIKNEPEFDWYNDLLKHTKLRIWIAGIIIMVFFCFFTWLEMPSLFNAYYVSALLRSFMMTIILNRTVNSVLNSYIEKRMKSLDKDKDKGI